MAKYNQRIGDLVVKFIDYFRLRQQSPLEGEDTLSVGEALEQFSLSNVLTAGEAYQIAQYLRGQNYDIDPLAFHPQYDSEEKDQSVFGEYNDALTRGEYEKAHRIFESMTPIQKQIIEDRRGYMKKNFVKSAQQPEPKLDTEAVIEKQVPAETPAEEVRLVKELPQAEPEEMAEIMQPAELLVANYSKMHLSPDSETVFAPFAKSLDEFKHVRQQRSLDQSTQQELRQKTQDFLRNYGKVLMYLERQGYGQHVQQLIALVGNYMKLAFAKPTSAAAAQKILALAGRLQEKGMSGIASKLMKTLTATSEETEENLMQWLAEKEDFKEPGKSTVEQAEQVISNNPLIQFGDLLGQGKYDEAREIYLSLSPTDRMQADQIAKKHYAVTSIVSLYRVGESLFNKGKTAEADQISNIVKAQFVELPQDLQKEIVVLIVPQDQLPQAFKGNEGVGVEQKMKEMQERLAPPCPCGGKGKGHQHGNPCGEEAVAPCDMITSAKTISLLLKLADNLDEKGQPRIVDQIVALLEGFNKQAQEAPNPPKRDVGVTNCKLCGKEIYYDKAKGAPKWCVHCGKQPWAKTSAVTAQQPIKPIEFKYTPEAVEKAFQRIESPEPKRDIGVTNCKLCGQEIYYNKAEGAPKWCAHCGKQPWARIGSVKTAEDKEVIPGGLAKGKKDEEFDEKQLEKGIKVELEHTGDVETAKEITKDHLTENCEYYDHLEEMEKKMDQKKKGAKIRSFVVQAAKDEHGGKPAKVVEIADAIRRDNPGISDEAAYRMAWETLCSYVDPSYEGCTEKGKSKRESPKPYDK